MSRPIQITPKEIHLLAKNFEAASAQLKEIASSLSSSLSSIQSKWDHVEN